MDLRRVLAFLVTLCASGLALGSEFRIHYAEPVHLTSESVAQLSKPQRNRNIAFKAYGRTFNLQLEPNDRLTRRLSATQRASAPELYQGAILNTPDSWVRLTRVSGRFSGVVWDGNDLYMIGGADQFAAAMITPVDSTSNPDVIFRLADTENLLPQDFCAAHQIASGNGRTQYKALVGQLQAPAASISGDVEVAVLADSIISGDLGSATLSNILAWMNIVDGIFASQVGVRIVPTDFVIFQAGNDPVANAAPDQVLPRIGDYRSSHPTIRNRGAAHMFTGKLLGGTAIGRAYLGGLCDPSLGVGATKADYDLSLVPLIVVHELGHNFGAPHDAEAGSVCASTPPTYIMAPNAGPSGQFSNCSLQQIQQKLATATCILPPKQADVAVSVDATALDQIAGQEFDLPIDIAVTGDRTEDVVQLQLELASVNLISATTVGADVCIPGDGVVDCTLSTMNPGDTRRILVRARADRIGSYSGRATVRSAYDTNSANDTELFTLTVHTGSDVAITASTPSITALTNETFTMTYDVQAVGDEAATAVVADVKLQPSTGDFALSVDQYSADSGVCTLSATLVQCQFDSIPVGATRRITVKAHVATVVSGTLTAQVSSNNHGDAINRSASTQIEIRPRQDVGIILFSSDYLGVVGQPFDLPIYVRANGTQSSSNVVLTMTLSASIVQQVTGSGATCSIAGTVVTCALGTLTAGEQRGVLLSLQSATPISYATLSLHVTSTGDEYAANDSGTTTLKSKYAFDVRLQQLSAKGFEGRGGTLTMALDSVGVFAANNLVVTGTTSGTYPFTDVTLPNGTCTTTATTFTCSLLSLTDTSSALLAIKFQANVPGTATIAVAAMSNGDGDATNNNVTASVVVLPANDVRVTTSADAIPNKPGEVATIPVTIGTDLRPMNDVTLTVYTYPSVSVQSVSAQGATCTVLTPQTATCTFPLIDGNSTRAIQVAVRSDATLQSSVKLPVSFSVAAPSDVDSSNDVQTVQLDVQIWGDAAVSVSGTSVRAIPMAAFVLPEITVTGVEFLENVELVVTLPQAALNSSSVGGLQGECAQQQDGTIHCHIGILPAGAQRLVDLSVYINSVASFTATVEVRAAYDKDSSNNLRTVSVDIVPADQLNPPPKTNTPSTPPKSGGGGSFEWIGLLALLALVSFDRKRRYKV